VLDWFAGVFTADAVGALLAILALQRSPTSGFGQRASWLWTYLSWALGPPLLNAVEPHLATDDADIPAAIVRLEMVGGIVNALSRWPARDSADALDRVVIQIMV
jgi:hypothetical protein